MRSLSLCVVVSVSVFLVSACGGGEDWVTIESRELVVNTSEDDLVMFDTGPVDDCYLTLGREGLPEYGPITHRLSPDSVDSYLGSSTTYTFEDCIGVRYTTNKDTIDDVLSKGR